MTRVLQPAEAEWLNADVMNCCRGEPSNTRSAAAFDSPFAEISPGMEKCVPGLCRSTLRTVSSASLFEMINAACPRSPIHRQG
jgi:hypothetical protein